MAELTMSEKYKRDFKKQGKKSDPKTPVKKEFDELSGDYVEHLTGKKPK